MGTLTVKLSQPLQAKLDALVKKRGLSKSDLVREAIERLVDGAERRPQVSVHDLIKDLIGPGRGPKDLSTNPKHMKGFGK
jgi:Arc/MetJ-type ribon-helix-helix transcriptional regulator